MKERNYLFLRLLEESWYKECESCWESEKLSGTEISMVCPHKKNRNWRGFFMYFLFWFSVSPSVTCFSPFTPFTPLYSP